jgi:glucose/arabinose dehydrogenase
MPNCHRVISRACLLAAVTVVLATPWNRGLRAQAPGPEVLVPNLSVRTVVSGLTTPTAIGLLPGGGLLVLEKNTGQVKHVAGGTVQGTVLDLAVNFGSERGLLGVAMHPDFPSDPGVYLYWTESTTGADSNVLSETPLLGNRVDRYVWSGSGLTFDRNIIRLRAIQQDAGQPERGNHDGGVIAFGLDSKLYVFVGDVGRRGHLQNLPCGPTATCPGPVVPDDQFGGPEPDDAHLTGVVLRLNDDGSAPSDNPFFAAGAAMGGEAGANIQKVFSYGHRNSFGMAVDPLSGAVWVQENGDDSFSELNRVTAGMNGGWIQIAGPVGRIAQFREIETTFGSQALQQIRWPPTNIAMTPGEALSRLFMLPGAEYSDPEFSGKWEVAPAGRLPEQPGARAAVSRGPVRGRRDAAARGRVPVPLRAHGQSPGRRHGRSAARRSRRRQPRQARDHREREPAVRTQLRDRHGRRDRTGRHAARRVPERRCGV